LDIWDEDLVIVCWFYVKNCTFEDITKFCRWSAASKIPGPTPPPKKKSGGTRTAPGLDALLSTV